MPTTHMVTVYSCIPQILILFKTLNTIGSLHCEQKETHHHPLFYFCMLSLKSIGWKLSADMTICYSIVLQVNPN